MISQCSLHIDRMCTRKKNANLKNDNDISEPCTQITQKNMNTPSHAKNLVESIATVERMPHDSIAKSMTST